MRLTLIIAALIFLADQVSKWLVVMGLDLANLGAIDVLPPYVNLRMAWNYGINFGLFADGSTAARFALIALALVICGMVLIWLYRAPPPRLGLISGGLLLGGALGNVADRVIYGAVADFLNMSCCGIENPYSFNLADICIFAGAIGLAVFGDGAAKPKA